MERPKILYHIDFYDIPLCGIALYEGQKVYFQIASKGGYISTYQKDKFPEEIINSLNMNNIKIDKTEEDCDIISIDTDNYTSEIIIFSKDYPDYIINKIIDLEFDGFGEYFWSDTFPYLLVDDKKIYVEIQIYKRPWYNFYQLPDHLIDSIDKEHKLFQEYVGYHSDHDPEIYNNVL